MNNTQILEMALSTISCTLVVVLTYLVAKITLRITMKKTREEITMLYDLLDERDDELNRYYKMFGPLKDWEDSEWAERSEKKGLENSLFGEEDNVKGEYLTPQQIEERYNSMGPNEDDDLPF